MIAAVLEFVSLNGLQQRALTGPGSVPPVPISEILLSVPKLKTLTNPSLYPHAAIVSSWLNFATMSSAVSGMTAFIRILFLSGIFSIILQLSH